MIIPMIFIFLSCLEKAYDNKEVSRENSKSSSWITNQDSLSQTLIFVMSQPCEIYLNCAWTLMKWLLIFFCVNTGGRKDI